MGFHSDGAFADYLQIPAYTLAKVPERVSDQAAAVVEPLAVGLHAVDRSHLKPGETAAVIGYGMIGAAVAAMALAAGAGAVFVVEALPHRRDIAKRAGATEVFAPNTNVGEEIFRRTDRVGADVVIDCTGGAAQFADSIELSRRGGRIAICGLSGVPAQLDLNRLVFFEREIVGVLGYRFDHARVLRLLETGLLDVAPLVGGPVGLSEIVPMGFERILNDSTAPLRILVDPSA